jgi:peptide/nickel transport system permease protein
MIHFLQRLFYGFLVLLGVIFLVFTLFTLVPDPARELAGQNESPEVIEAIRKKHRLDLSYFPRLGYFLNDLSPVGFHSKSQDEAAFIDTDKISCLQLMDSENGVLLLKWPYLGRSFLSERSVSQIIGEALPGTAVLALSAISIALILGIALGVFTALRKDSFLDHLTMVLASLGMSGPSFFMAILIAWLGGTVFFDQIRIPLWPLVFILLFFGLKQFSKLKKSSFFQQWWLALGLFMGSGVFFFLNQNGANTSFNYLNLPGTGLSSTGSLYEVDVWEGKRLALVNLILPAITLGIRPLAVITQLTRSSLLEVMQEDYIRTAYAKGLSKSQVIRKHAIKNALNPVVTAASGWFASMLAGAVFVEFVFGWKGIGFEVFQALEKNDLPVVMGAVLVIASTFVIINIAVDLIYGWLDPRARVS